MMIANQMKVNSTLNIMYLIRLEISHIQSDINVEMELKEMRTTG